MFNANPILALAALCILASCTTSTPPDPASQNVAPAVTVTKKNPVPVKKRIAPMPRPKGTYWVSGAGMTAL